VLHGLYGSPSVVRVMTSRGYER